MADMEFQIEIRIVDQPRLVEAERMVDFRRS